MSISPTLSQSLTPGGFALSVNLNKIALIRNSREGNHPNLREFAQTCIEEGVAGLTVHPRPDQRHIRPDDVITLGLMCQQAGIEFNIEGNPFAAPKGDYPGLLALVKAAKPTQCTLVPDSDSQLTSDHGFDLNKSAETLAPILEQLKPYSTRISLFMDPDVEQIRLAKTVGADRVELYTGPFAWAYEKGQASGEAEFEKHCTAALLAHELGLGINAGHDLNLENMALYKTLPGLQEVSIGHALTVDALKIGFRNALKAYIAVCS
ncbi:MAG: pyridoxine 5'-phosphate synthase [Agarilytica sp.]